MPISLSLEGQVRAGHQHYVPGFWYRDNLGKTFTVGGLSLAAGDVLVVMVAVDATYYFGGSFGNPAYVDAMDLDGTALTMMVGRPAGPSGICRAELWALQAAAPMSGTLTITTKNDVGCVNAFAVKATGCRTDVSPFGSASQDGRTTHGPEHYAVVSSPALTFAEGVLIGASLVGAGWSEEGHTGTDDTALGHLYLEHDDPAIDFLDVFDAGYKAFSGKVPGVDTDELSWFNPDKICADYSVMLELGEAPPAPVTEIYPKAMMTL